MFTINLCEIKQWLIIFLATNSLLVAPEARATKQSQSESQKLIQNRTNADLTLLGQLAEKPQLMNVSYLQCYLGPSDGQLNSTYVPPQHKSVPASTTYWRTIGGYHVAYKLTNSTIGQNDQVVEFNSKVPENTHIRLKDVDKVLNVSAKPSFDEQGAPISEYDSRPDTRVLVYERPGLADIIKIRIYYSGSPLPPPSAQDMQQAIKYRRDTAFAFKKQGNYDQAIPMLRAHLQSNPADAEAHLKLAECYKAKCQVNDSIAEYRTALDKSGDDNDLHKSCLKGLESLKVKSPELSAESQSPSLTNAPIINNPSNKLDVGF